MSWVSGKQDKLDGGNPIVDAGLGRVEDSQERALSCGVDDMPGAQRMLKGRAL